MSIVREKKIYCGENYMEVDIFPTVEMKKYRKGKRAKKKKESLPVQKNLNDKNAKRKFVQLAETNFGQDDIVLHLTYSDENLPKSIEQMEKEIKNFLRRLKRKRQKENLEDLKYILVTSYTTVEDEEEGVEEVRPHHHLLINKGLDRDTIEKLWTKKKDKGKSAVMLGYANAQRIQYNDIEGITRLSQYLARNITQKRRWTCSQNLKRPESRTNDHKYSHRKLEKMATGYLDVGLWEKLYPGWTVKDKENGYQAVYSEWTGWSIYLKLRKKE